MIHIKTEALLPAICVTVWLKCRASIPELKISISVGYLQQMQSVGSLEDRHFLALAHILLQLLAVL